MSNPNQGQAWTLAEAQAWLEIERKKVRELEAELADERQFIWMAKKEIEELRMWRGEAEVQRARVRKALVDQTVSMNGSAQWKARAEKAEARVAELEAMLRRPTRDERVDEGRRVIEEWEAD